MGKQKDGRDLPEGIYPNKYRKKCAHPSCEVMVEPGEGFIERVEGGKVTWRTWCPEHVPQETTPAEHAGRDQRSDEYYDQMIVVTQHGKPVAEEEIARCAKELGIARFPRGYPELMTRFGGGEFNHFFRIRTPAEIVEHREKFPNFRSIDIGDSIDGDRFCFNPNKPDWLFVIPRHHSGILGGGWGLANLLDWLTTDMELNEGAIITEIYYRPNSDETCMVRLRQTKTAPSGEALEKILGQVLEPDRRIRRYTDKGDRLELFYPAYGGHIEYSTSPQHTQLFLWLDCQTAAEFLKLVLPPLPACGFDEVIHTQNVPEGVKVEV